MLVRRVGTTTACVVRALIIGAAIQLAPCGALAQGPTSAPPAETAPAEGADLAKKLSNPVSDLVSVPLQFNWAQGVGPDNDTRFILNFQPVMPFSLNENWNLIARVIVPFVGQPALFAGGAPASGVSDVLASFFVSPSRSSGVTWGVGPALSLPSTNEPTLGSGKWSMGPTVVVLKQSGPWTVGALWNQVWSVAGNDTRTDVSQMYLQPFVAYTTKGLVTVNLNSESTANWKADDDRWTVPINLSVSKLSSFGVFPASYQVAVGFYVAGPDDGPEWQLRAGITVLLPRRR